VPAVAVIQKGLTLLCVIWRKGYVGAAKLKIIIKFLKNV